MFQHWKFTRYNKNDNKTYNKIYENMKNKIYFLLFVILHKMKKDFACEHIFICIYLGLVSLKDSPTKRTFLSSVAYLPKKKEKRWNKN